MRNKIKSVTSSLSPNYKMSNKTISYKTLGFHPAGSAVLSVKMFRKKTEKSKKKKKNTKN